jgi:hypothetical protein
VESCRRDLLDHVKALDESHVKRLISVYVQYYHEDRTHLRLGKRTPNRRSASKASGRVLSLPRLGGLHHSYDRAAQFVRPSAHPYLYVSPMLEQLPAQARLGMPRPVHR